MVHRGGVAPNIAYTMASAMKNYSGSMWHYSDNAWNNSYEDVNNSLSLDLSDNLKTKAWKDVSSSQMTIFGLATFVKINTINIQSGRFTVTTEANNFNNGTSLNIGGINITNLNTNGLFFQNIKKAKIDSIIIDKTLFNKDGTDAIYKKHGIIALKWDNALSDSIDKRTAYIGKYIVKNTNLKDTLINELGERITYKDQEIWIKAIWLDEGTNNIIFGKMDIDIPMMITPCNEYCPPSTGNNSSHRLNTHIGSSNWVSS